MNVSLFSRGVRLFHTTPAACRGTKHLDWWVRARARAPRTPPRVFPAETLHGRPRRRAFIDFSLGGGGAPAEGKAAPALSRVVFELADDIVPVTVSNFLTLGARPRATTGYVGAEVFKAQKGFAIFVGDAAAGPDGRLGHSSFRARYFPDENFIGRHSEPGVLAMASAGVHTNASVFYVTLAKAPHLGARAASRVRCTLERSHDALVQTRSPSASHFYPSAPLPPPHSTRWSMCRFRQDAHWIEHARRYWDDAVS